ncbi:MAG TPA: hypothetical protein VN811_05200 [Thermoanaerobaculia bacterium]|nr:hypothetical protein [Thermoanaerobaculia bacterium]
MTTQAPSLAHRSSLLEGRSAARPQLSGLRAVLYGGLTVGILDITDALVFFGLYVPATPIRIFHSVAAGLLGREAARAGGIPTAILGGVLHFTIATIITTIYFLVSRKLPALVRRPVLYGILYGIVCYFVMSFVVIPLSNAGVPGRGLHWPEWPVLVNGIVGHALLVGLPAALWVSRAGEPAR